MGNAGKKLDKPLRVDMSFEELLHIAATTPKHKEVVTVNDVLKKIAPIFEKVKKEIDKYPKVFGLHYEETDGYTISADLGLLEHHLVKARLE